MQVFVCEPKRERNREETSEIIMTQINSVRLNEVISLLIIKDNGGNFTRSNQAKLTAINCTDSLQLSFST